MPEEDPERLVRDHNEWVDHMWNPYYFVNRISWAQRASWRWTRKHNRLEGSLGMLLSGTFLIAFMISSDPAEPGQPIIVAIFTGSLTLDELYHLALASVFAFVFIASAILFSLKPVSSGADQVPPRARERKKKLPKRRKDYR